MPQVGPIKRRDLIRYLRQLGFEGPYAGGNHQYMVRGQLRLFIPIPTAETLTRVAAPHLAPSRTRAFRVGTTLVNSKLLPQSLRQAQRRHATRHAE